MSNKELTRMELEEMIIKKALQEEDFKKLLLSDPHKAIAEMGLDIPADMEINILEETAQTSYLVLPHISEELSDDALELIAGGTSCNCNQQCLNFGGGYHNNSN
jgi:hypothetical protein